MPVFVSIGHLPHPLTATRSHHHVDTWEVCCYRQGEGVVSIAGRELAFAPGTIVVIPPGCTHRERSAGGFTTDFLHLREVESELPGVLVLHDDDQGSYRTLADQLEREYTLREAGWRPVCQQLTAVLVHYLKRWAAGDADGDDLVARIKHRCAEHLHDPTYSAGNALDGLRCTPDHARRLFRRATGVAPAVYL
nr:AraC family ligand binding domain-containing protein [Planctomycetota bacterium]